MRNPLALFCLVALCTAAGCRRARPTTDAPDRAHRPLDQEYCWWTSLRTTLPPDSVGARFELAFVTLGFSDITRRVIADTGIYDHSTRTSEPVTRATLTYARASKLPGDSSGTIVEGLALAWVRADTTRVRYYFARQPEFSSGAEKIGRCRALWTAAMGTPSGPNDER